MSDEDHEVRVVLPRSETRYLEGLIDGTVINEERAVFAEAWYGRVRTVLTDDELFQSRRGTSRTRSSGSVQLLSERPDGLKPIRLVPKSLRKWVRYDHFHQWPKPLSSLRGRR